MSVRQGFLALLSEQPMNGYQLRQEFERRTGGSWPLNIGQAYTTLNRLHRDGLVGTVDDQTPVEDQTSVDAQAPGSDQAPDGEPRETPPAGRPAERYHLTDLGRETAVSWWTTPVHRGKAERDELAIKVALAVTVPGVDVAAVVREQRSETMRALRALTQAKRDVDPVTDRARALVLDAQVFAIEAETRWLDHVEATVSSTPRTERPKRNRR
ncbi:PadR family transcriptional regulator [Promicromonospora sp. NPDC057488]|uniref:PadR family transcriptional regulator n=1 Tax=Promicromonospora sp. NPDC057488 TaxID=3346147 RepID=UPI00366C5987